MKNFVKLIMALLYSEITDSKIDNSLFFDMTDEEWKHLYNLSKSQDLAHLTGDAVLKNGLLSNDEIKSTFEKQLTKSVYRYESIQYEIDEIRRILNEEKIPFILLKGSVIRDYYPQPWMRTSGDIDVLIHYDDFSRAVELLKNNGYVQFHQTAYDISFATREKVNVELHHGLIEEGHIGKAEELLSSVWDYAAPVSDSYEYRLADEMFYYYHIAHMAKHFESGGGCGIRYFLDLWILNHRVPHDGSARNTLLSLGGLDKFAAAANELSDYWLEGAKPSSLTLQLETFALTGGVHGMDKNSAIIGTGKRKSKFKYVTERIWVPYNKLIGEYPNLKGKRILQPFYEVCRWFHLFKKDTFERSKAELKSSIGTSDEEKEQTLKMLSDLGLV